MRRNLKSPISLKFFAREMENIFGNGSSIMLETIVKKLYSNLEIEYKEEHSFQEYIKEAIKNI
jgi:hypothetical protein